MPSRCRKRRPIQGPSRTFLSRPIAGTMLSGSVTCCASQQRSCRYPNRGNRSEARKRPHGVLVLQACQHGTAVQDRSLKAQHRPFSGPQALARLEVVACYLGQWPFLGWLRRQLNGKEGWRVDWRPAYRMAPISFPFVSRNRTSVPTVGIVDFGIVVVPPSAFTAA